MIFNRVKIAFLVGTSLLVLSCNNSTVTTTTQPSVPDTSKLIFTGTANTGGDIKITLDDPALETMLDGNPDYTSNMLQALPMLPPRFSLISVDITDLNYN